MAVHERHKLFFLESSLLLILSIGYAASKNVQPAYTCGGGVVTPGYTYPLGDITLEYGNSLEILCVLHDNKAKNFGPNPSSLMSIKYVNRTQPTDIVNSTAIRLHIDKHMSTTSADYSCFVNGTFVCHNVVVVGSKPQPVTDFKCIGYNYENLTCTWTPPENFVTTDYHLEYSPSARPARTASKCPKISYKENRETKKTMLSCTWNFSTRPQYRHAHDRYRFSLTANNTFGNVTWAFMFEHFPNVVPNAPENLTANATSPHSIRLSWLVPIKMQFFPGGIVHRISWWIKGYNNWTTMPLIKDEKIPHKDMTFDLIDLPYAHCLYDIRVSMKSLKATDESLWSQNSSVTVWTKPKLPERPPRTNIGSFEILQSGNRIVYWRKINEYEENGENFSYHIEVEGHPDYKPYKANSNYARFENLTNSDYTFKIWSKNDLGRSIDYSEVFMPSPSHALKPPSKLVKVDRGHGQYDLEWVESESPDVTNYTLFWCLDPKDRPYQCDGVMNWTVIPKGSNNYNLWLPEVNKETRRPNNYQFAISANGYGISSGMLWAECTVIPGRGTKLSQIYVKSVDRRSITIVWKLECFKRGDVAGFNITYCPVVSSPESTECKNNSLNYKFINEPDVEEGVIQGLKPYTRYKIQVKPLLTNGIMSQFSEPKINSTLQDAPSEPRNLRVINKSESSLTIEWEKPEEENGVITHYNIFVNDSLKKTINSYKNSNVYTENIANLTSRSNYDIKVKACVNTMCSEALIQNDTEIGYPGPIPKPAGNWDNHSLVIRWDKPNPTYIRVDYYEVLIETSNKEDSETINATDQNYLVSICGKDKSQSVFVNIRAVNIAAGKALKGPWSEQAYFPCFRSPSSATWVIIIIVMSVIFFVGLMIYLTKQLCSYIKIMSDVPVKLPDGLLAVMETYQEKEKHIDDTLPPDKPLLSKQFQSQPRNPSGESSGCCSGTESVSSSVESAGHLSMSDSGTEQPISPCLGDSEGSVALRQRVTKPNVKKTDYVTMPEITQSSWSPKQSQGGYSVIGMAAPPKKPESDHEYMVLSDLPSKSSYVPFPGPQTQDPTRDSPAKQTSGYVPYMTQEPAAKNTDYVLAGVPTKQTMPLAKMPSSYTTQKEEPSSGYVKAPPMIIEAPKLLLPWQQQSSMEPPPTGYVVVGDPKPQKTALDMPKGGNKGYVPHNIKFDTAKSFKED